MNRILVSLLLSGVVNVCHAQFRPDCSCSFQDLYKLNIKSITDSTFNLQTGEKYKTSEMVFDDHGRPKETLRFNRNGALEHRNETQYFGDLPLLETIPKSDGKEITSVSIHAYSGRILQKTFEYDGSGHLSNTVVYKFDGDSSLSTKYNYNNQYSALDTLNGEDIRVRCRNGKLFKQEYTLWSTENKHQKVYNSIIFTYDQIKYDSRGNWISRQVTGEEDWAGHKGVYKFIETRKVIYWD